jgi:monoamine oxidase
VVTFHLFSAYNDTSLSIILSSHGLGHTTLLNFSDRIHQKKAVVQIRYTDVGVLVKTLDGTVFNGSYVILAIPPPAHVNTVLSFTAVTDLFI